MFKQTLLGILSFSFASLAAQSLDHSRSHRREKPIWSTCLTANQGCRDIYALVQRCWDTGVPSGNLDPNDGDVSNGFRTCFCGDTKTTNEDSWPSCAYCIMNASKGGAYANVENTKIVTWCASPDPNLYVWLSGFLNFTLTTDPDALSPPSPVLTGPVTAISTLCPKYSPNPGANSIPSGIYQLTTATLSSWPTSADTASATQSASDVDDGSGGLLQTSTVQGNDGNGVLTILYYTDSATSMYIVGPASELQSFSTRSASGAATAMAAAQTVDANITTGKFVQGGRTVLIVGPAETGTGVGSGKTRQPDGVGPVSVAGERVKGTTPKRLAGIVLSVMIGVVVVAERVW